MDPTELSNIDLTKIGIAPKQPKAVKVRAFDECTPIDEKKYRLVGTVTRAEAMVLEGVLALSRREAGSLQMEELQLVASLLTLVRGVG